MSSEHIKFIATNMGLESIQHLDVRCEALEQGMKALTKQVNEAVTSAKTAANQATDFVKW